ncbi:unnamed protein product [Urochloa humidicola]
MMQGGSKQKMLSPRCGGVQKKRVSPTAAPKVDRKRASWNLGLEKGLVELLHYHNNDCYRGQNGWSSEAWNRIVKMFQERFSYVSFTKTQIQEKEKELKRDYHLLKEAKQQSGSHFNSTLGMIEADPAVWNNIITSFPKAKKFQTKPFPLFDTLGELYDGHTAQGSLNFTSAVSKPSEQEQPIENEASENGDYNSALRATPQLYLDDDDDDGVMTLQQPSQRGAGTTSNRPFASRSEKDFAPPNASRVEKGSALSNARRMEGKKQKQDNVAGMMQKYLEVRMIQVEGEVADKAKAVAEADDFSIKNCISHLNTIEELSGEERAEAFDVFKDAQNRQIFMTAEPISRLIWLRKEMRKALAAAERL